MPTLQMQPYKGRSSVERMIGREDGELDASCDRCLLALADVSKLKQTWHARTPMAIFISNWSLELLTVSLPPQPPRWRAEARLRIAF